MFKYAKCVARENNTAKVRPKRRRRHTGLTERGLPFAILLLYSYTVYRFIRWAKRTRRIGFTSVRFVCFFLVRISFDFDENILLNIWNWKIASGCLHKTDGTVRVVWLTSSKTLRLDKTNYTCPNKRTTASALFGYDGFTFTSRACSSPK